MKTTLIQRGEIKDRDFKQGIDSIVEFDYMGASEYEWELCQDHSTSYVKT